MMTSKTVNVADIGYNPFRDVERNPMSEERIAALMDSIDRNDLWRGIVARPTADGYQLAFGHHRLEAIKRLGIETIEVDLADLSDAQMLQFLSDENLNQGGKSASAAFEVVVAARFMLDQYLRESETPEEFDHKANMVYFTAAGSSENYDSFGRVKSAGVVGRDILRLFLCGEKHSHGWNNNALAAGINYVDAHYRADEARRAKEKARAEYEAIANSPVPDDDRLAELDAQQHQADADLREAEEFKGYRDVMEMFPAMENGVIYVRELRKRHDAGNPVPKTDQIRFARQLVNDGTGKRDIPRRLGELIEGKKEWDRQERKRLREKKKAERERKEQRKNQWTREHSMTPDQYIRENLGVFNRMNAFLDQLALVYEFVEDEDLLGEFTVAAQQTRDRLTAFAVGLPESTEKKIS